MSVVLKNNQINIIKKFINTNEKTILINQINESLSIFYLEIIKYFANQEQIKLNMSNDLSITGFENDLFGKEEIKIFFITNLSKLNKALDITNKKIIFTDYKNYKKFNSKFISINGYQFEKDISFFIKKEMGIDDDELIYFCQCNPALLFSEISKCLINNNKYKVDKNLDEEKNHILNIRKSIFEIKRNKLDIKNLYLNIKKESRYKKFSFLTY